MDYLIITKGMFEQDVEEGRKFYEFFGWEDIEDVLYFFSEGEDAEARGFVCGYSHYENVNQLEVGDIVVQQGEYKYRLIRKEYADLFKDSLICDKYEKLLDKIYQSGNLSKELEELYKIEVIGE